MNKKSAKIIVIVLPLLVALGVIIFVAINRRTETLTLLPSPTPKPTQNPTVETEKTDKSDADLIKDALVEKNNWNPSEIKVTVSKNDGIYAAGGVGAVTPQGGGGLWFAAKVNGNWQIVWDGNGIVMCENLTNYPDFPTELIPQCYDSSLDKMVDRQ